MNPVVVRTSPFVVEPLPEDARLAGDVRASKMHDPGFGRVLTEHMVTIRWSERSGWHDARLGPYADITLDPAAACLHYGQIVFEGLKAYALADGGVGVFRPDLHARRLCRSANRLAMPELPESLFLDAVAELVRADRAWVPTRPGTGLYLRPVLLATEADLGLRPANEYLFLLVAFVTDTFFPGAVRPVTVWVCDDYSRAAPGGTGEAKCPGNYAASLLPQREAQDRGCDQVVWLDAVQRQWVEEMGGMNMFFVYGPTEAPRLSTPPLDGTILPGVTRDALIVLARAHGYPVSEEPLRVSDWRHAATSGELLETFACGTAAVVAPIGGVRSNAGDWSIADGRPGVVTMRLREALTDIQYGLAKDPYGWIFPIR